MKTTTHSTRLPAPMAILGTLAPHDPTTLDLGAILPGYTVTAEVFDLPLLLRGATEEERKVIHFVRASDTRAYLYPRVGMGWWRVDTASPAVPEPDEVLGELTPATNVSYQVVVAATDLRVDDLMCASGFGEDGGRGWARVLDLIHQIDGRGPVTLVRVSDGWYRWRLPFAHVAHY